MPANQSYLFEIVFHFTSTFFWKMTETIHIYFAFLNMCSFLTVLDSRLVYSADFTYVCLHFIGRMMWTAKSQCWHLLEFSSTLDYYMCLLQICDISIIHRCGYRIEYGDFRFILFFLLAFYCSLNTANITFFWINISLSFLVENIFQDNRTFTKNITTHSLHHHL